MPATQFSRDVSSRPLSVPATLTLGRRITACVVDHRADGARVSCPLLPPSIGDHAVLSVFGLRRKARVVWVAGLESGLAYVPDA